MKLDISKQITERFEFIETRLFWGEGFTANELAETFGISRQAPQKSIGDYRKIQPGQMKYFPKKKRHYASDFFIPRYIKPEPKKFLDYLRGQTLSGYYREQEDWSDLHLTDANRHLQSKLNREAVQVLIHALQHKETVLMDYRQKDTDFDRLTLRIISPNHLVYADNRYHIRAYCHSLGYFLDFALSRIVHAEIASEEWVSSRQDTEWNTYVSLHFTPNPNLTPRLQSAILMNYAEQNSGEWVITCREALAFYIIRQLTKRKDSKYDIPLWCLKEKRMS